MECEKPSILAQFAAKVIPRDTIRDLSEADRVSREFMILTSLEHPHVVRLYDVFMDSGNIYLIMELAERGSLAKVMEHSGPLSERRARRVMVQLVDAVRYCHRNRVVHRDIKPENILVGEGGVFKVADFGLSNTMRQNGRASSPVGTPLYSAPEVLFGDVSGDGGGYDASACDVWSLGCVLFRLVFSRHPFEASNKRELRSKILDERLEIPRRTARGQVTSMSLRSLLSGMLCVDSSMRLTVDEVWRHLWLGGRLGREETERGILLDEEDAVLADEDGVSLSSSGSNLEEWLEGKKEPKTDTTHPPNQPKLRLTKSEAPIDTSDSLIPPTDTDHILMQRAKTDGPKNDDPRLTSSKLGTMPIGDRRIAVKEHASKVYGVPDLEVDLDRSMEFNNNHRHNQHSHTHSTSTDSTPKLHHQNSATSASQILASQHSFPRRARASAPPTTVSSATPSSRPSGIHVPDNFPSPRSQMISPLLTPGEEPKQPADLALPEAAKISSPLQTYSPSPASAAARARLAGRRGRGVSVDLVDAASTGSASPSFQRHRSHSSITGNAGSPRSPAKSPFARAARATLAVSRVAVASKPPRTRRASVERLLLERPRRASAQESLAAAAAAAREELSEAQGSVTPAARPINRGWRPRGRW